MIRIGTTSFAAHNDMARRRLVVCVAALGTATAVQQARYGLPGPAPSALAEGRRLTDDSATQPTIAEEAYYSVADDADLLTNVRAAPGLLQRRGLRDQRVYTEAQEKRCQRKRKRDAKEIKATLGVFGCLFGLFLMCFMFSLQQSSFSTDTCGRTDESNEADSPTACFCGFALLFLAVIIVVGCFRPETCKRIDSTMSPGSDGFAERGLPVVQACDIEMSNLTSSPSNTTNHGWGTEWCFGTLNDTVGCTASPSECWETCADAHDDLVAIDWWSNEGGACYCQNDCQCMKTSATTNATYGYIITRNSVGALPEECGTLNSNLSNGKRWGSIRFWGILAPLLVFGFCCCNIFASKFKPGRPFSGLSQDELDAKLRRAYAARKLAVRTGSDTAVAIRDIRICLYECNQRAEAEWWLSHGP